jgi:hypothetical protein
MQRRGQPLPRLGKLRYLNRQDRVAPQRSAGVFFGAAHESGAALPFFEKIVRRQNVRTGSAKARKRPVV